MSFDDRHFRDALGQFPTGVAIVSAVAASGDWLGITVSSFNSVSLSPPLVLFNLARLAASFAAWRNVPHFAIGVLNENQEDLSNRFARPGGEKWKGMTSLIGRTGVPILAGTLATFECETYARYDGGDHEIIIGRVIELHCTKTKPSRPLVVAEGRYHRLATSSTEGAPPVDPLLLYGW
jgi:flavin reductase (DIM6/NTAB) family NADH-FMN oxidoreductase RutF